MTYWLPDYHGLARKRLYNRWRFLFSSLIERAPLYLASPTPCHHIQVLSHTILFKLTVSLKSIISSLYLRLGKSNNMLQSPQQTSIELWFRHISDSNVSVLNYYAIVLLLSETKIGRINTIRNDRTFGEGHELQNFISARLSQTHGSFV